MERTYYVDESGLTETRKSPTEVGLDQERLIKKIIVDVAATQLIVSNIIAQAQNVRQQLVWRTNGRTWIVNWYRPNTHPLAVGEVHAPDFDFWVDDKRLANLESKNWQPKYPLSLNQTKEKIISRVAGRQVELGNILVISELLCEKGDEPQILTLLREHKFKVVLTHGQTENSDDESMYRIIRSGLEPILVYVFSLTGPKPDWALFLINPKSSSLTILVLSRTPPSQLV